MYIICTMVVYKKALEFDWDKANIDKSYKKHGTTTSETEEIFLDENLRIIRDIKHSQKEDRFIALGKTQEGKVLFVVFTNRKEKIRVISARIAHKNERNYYEKKLK